MKTRTLTHRMSRYTSSNLAIAKEDRDILDEVVVDDEYFPNRVIVDEMIGEVNPPPIISNYDTAIKLLSDSNEAARRLEIIRMNVNYPVSGYRASQATIMKADPGIESMLHAPAFNLRQLNHAIEAKQSILFRVVMSVIASLVAGVISVVSMLVYRRFKHKRNGIDEVTFKNIFRAAASNDKLKWEAAAAILQTQAPRAHTSYGFAKKITLGQFIQALFIESTWSGLDKHTQAMITQPTFLDRNITNIDKFGAGIKGYLDDIMKIIATITVNVRDKKKMEPSDFATKNKELVAVVEDIKDSINTLNSASNEEPSLKAILKPMETAIEKATKIDYSKYARVTEDVKRLAKEVEGLSSSLNKNELDDEVYSSIKTEVDILKKAIVDLATVYTTIGRVEQGFDTLSNKIKVMNDEYRLAI